MPVAIVRHDSIHEFEKAVQNVVDSRYAFAMSSATTALHLSLVALEIKPGDEVLADKGFPQIEPDLNNVGAFLVMPPFKRGTRQFSDFENTEGYKCASVRIHVERAIRRLKYFEILNFLSNDLLFHIDKIIVVVAFLCNSMSDLIKKS